MFNVGIFYVLAILAVIITNFMDMAIAKIKSKYFLKIKTYYEKEKTIFISKPSSPSKKTLTMELGTLQFTYIIFIIKNLIFF